nr:DUF4846 domain-containing protein [bacterium]
MIKRPWSTPLAACMLLVLCGCSSVPTPPPRATPPPLEETAGLHVVTPPPPTTPRPEGPGPLNRAEGTTIATRFDVPQGYVRIAQPEGSFGAFLQQTALAASGTKAAYYDGHEKVEADYDAVVDMAVPKRDSFHAAHALMRMQALYLYAQGRYDDISFTFLSGFEFEFSRWRAGEIISVSGQSVIWTPGGKAETTLENLEAYLATAYLYTNLATLSKGLYSISVKEMSVGDVFYRDANPAHAAIIVDMAENPTTGQRVFILAQGFSTAQPMQVIKNPESWELSPWFEDDLATGIQAPGAIFESAHLYRMEAIVPRPSAQP